MGLWVVRRRVLPLPALRAASPAPIGEVFWDTPRCPFDEQIADGVRAWTFGNKARRTLERHPGIFVGWVGVQSSFGRCGLAGPSPRAGNGTSQSFRPPGQWRTAVISLP